MLPIQRRQAILAEVRRSDAVSAGQLARKYRVSLKTIRRDLRGPRDQGLLERVYGGAARSALNNDGKRAIGRLAASLAEPDDTIVIDVGTTALEVAGALPESFRRTGSARRTGRWTRAARSPASGSAPRASPPWPCWPASPRTTVKGR